MKIHPIARSAEPRSARVSSSMTDVPFVGREGELGALRACLADAGRGRGRVLLVGGEPGIGKTRFVEAAVGEARTLGFAVALGACDPYAGTPEYWPWRQMHRALATPEGSEPLAPTAPLLLGGGARGRSRQRVERSRRRRCARPAAVPTLRQRGACARPPSTPPARPLRPRGPPVGRSLVAPEIGRASCRERV